jgi:hypothetical protein
MLFTKLLLFSLTFYNITRLFVTVPKYSFLHSGIVFVLLVFFYKKTVVAPKLHNNRFLYKFTLALHKQFQGKSRNCM